MRLRTWTGLALGEKKASVFLNRPWMFLYCLLSCMIKLYNLICFLCVPCAFAIFAQYQPDLCPAQLSILLPISLCILSGEGSVAGNLIILSSAVDALVESHVLNWLRSCSINLSETPRAWFHLISDGVKTIDVSSWEMAVMAAQRVIVFSMWPGLLELACGELGMVKLVSVEFVNCLFFLFFTLATSLVFVCRCFFFCAALWGQLLLKGNFTQLDFTWQWLMMTEGFNTVLRGHQRAAGGRFQMTIVAVWRSPSLSPKHSS